MFQVSAITIIQCYYTVYLRVTVWYAGQGVIAVIGGVDVASTSFTWFIPESLRKKSNNYWGFFYRVHTPGMVVQASLSFRI